MESALRIDALLSQCKNGASQLAGFLDGRTWHLADFEIRARFADCVLDVEADAARVANDSLPRWCATTKASES
jgi:hypothetical protein